MRGADLAALGGIVGSSALSNGRIGSEAPHVPAAGAGSHHLRGSVPCGRARQRQSPWHKIAVSGSPSPPAPHPAMPPITFLLCCCGAQQPLQPLHGSCPTPRGWGTSALSTAALCLHPTTSRCTAPTSVHSQDAPTPQAATASASSMRRRCISPGKRLADNGCDHDATSSALPQHCFGRSGAEGCQLCRIRQFLPHHAPHCTRHALHPCSLAFPTPVHPLPV